MHNYSVELAALTRGIDMGQLAQVEPPTPKMDLFDHTKDTPAQSSKPGTGSGPFVAPGAVPAREQNWNFDADPAQYTIASGDTLVGLAKTYLGNGGWWPMIWNYGSNRDQFPNPDKLNHPGPLDMPPEARDNMLLWLKRGKPGTVVPGKLPPETIAEKGRRLWPWLLGGAAIGIGVAAIASGGRRG